MNARFTESFDRQSGSNSATGQSITGTRAAQAAIGASGTKTSTAGGFGDVGNTHILALRRFVANVPPTVSITSPPEQRYLHGAGERHAHCNGC